MTCARRARVALALVAAGLAVPAVARAQTAENVDRLSLDASLDVLYDDNIFRSNDERGGKDDDLVYHPNVTATYILPLGRNRLTTRGALGYTAYQNHGSRNRSLASIDVDGAVRVGGFCQVAPNVGYSRQELDYDDLLVRRENLRRTTSYGFSASCPKPVGLFPLVSVTGQDIRNSELFDYSDRTTHNYTAGIGYQRPSLGSLLLYYNHLTSDRTARLQKVTANSVGLRFNRSVSHRTRLTADIHYLDVSSDAVQSNNFSGLAWSVQGDLLPNPRLTITLNTGRSVNTASLISSQYAIESTYGLEADWQFTARSSIRLSGSYVHRRFRGLVPETAVALRTRDSTTRFEAEYRFRVNRRWYVGLAANKRHRDVDNPLLGYDVNQITATAGINI